MFLRPWALIFHVLGGHREVSTLLLLQLSLLHQQTERIVNEILAPRDPPGQENIADLLGRGAGNPTRFHNRGHKICFTAAENRSGFSSGPVRNPGVTG